jgi:hypothetical protein
MLSFAQAAGLLTHAGFALAGAAAISIPVIIHILSRMKRRPVQWGAMKFLLEAYRKHRRRLQLEQLLLLLVRCLVLFILGMALAGPLLGGCARHLGMDATGRTVCLVIDDGLSEQATNDEGAARFDRQKKLAIKMIDGLGSADQVAIYRTARPADGMIDPPTVDRASARRAVEKMQPRAARSDLIGAIKEARSTLTEKGIAADRAFILLLSDFSQGSLAVEQAMPAEGVRLDQQARILVTRPMASIGNVQISKFNPRRHMVLTGGYASQGPPRVPVEIELQHFADDKAARVTSIELALLAGETGKPLAVFPKEEVRWPAGEAKVSIQRDLILPDDALEALNLGAGTSGRASGATIVLRARIEPDALLEDNERYAVVELRQRLRTVIAGDATSVASPTDKEITPNRWMSIALAPGLDLGALEVTELPAFDLDEKKLAAIDAAMVLRPDQLSDAGWKALRQLIDRGGTVWLFAPSNGVPAQWGDALRTRLGVNWQIAIDAQDLTKDPTAPPVPAAPAPASATGLALSLDKPTPELMQRLAADWKELLRPVHVKKRLAVTVPGSAGADTVWLWTEDNKPLLASASVGDGTVFLLATALDLSWTNLPAKPLFVPLLHETLANVQARSVEAARLSRVISGDRPALGRVWDNVTQLDKMAGDLGGEVAGMALRRTDEGFVPVEPLDRPGIYRAAPAMPGRIFAVNVDPAGGNTTAIEQNQLDAWLTSLGETKWLDEENPAAALASFESRTNIGLLLLWITMAFLILELFMARAFSHAHSGAPHTMVGMGAALFNRFVGKHKETNG